MPRWLFRPIRTAALGIDPSIDLAPEGSKAGHTDKRLQTLKYPDELEAVMEKIASEARLAEQEAGLSTLFLTFGFLEWYESDDTEKAYFAPLLLLPVRVTRPERKRGRGRKVFGIAAREGEAETNVSLRRFLDLNYGRILPEFGDGHSDEPASVEAYFTAVTGAIEGLKRWRVRRQLVLGHFAFSRIAIYEDTDPARWSSHPADHTLVGALLAGFDSQPREGAAFKATDDYPIDDPAIEKIAPFLIHDADSSQHSALIDVMEGRNVVIEGPPGTGKSQTITNAIANLLAAGKSVLFLAEKQAALDAVKRRLDIAGLGDFCVELHSDKATPRAFVKSLADRQALVRGDGTMATSDPTWSAVRGDIRAYIDALHARQEDGATPFQLMWRAIHGRSVFTDAREVLRARVAPADGSPALLGALRGEVEVYSEAARSFGERHGHAAHSPWQRTPPEDIVGDQREALLAALAALRERTVDVAEAGQAMQALGVGNDGGIAAAETADATLRAPADAGAIAAVTAFDLDAIAGALGLLGREYEAAGTVQALGPAAFEDAVLARATALKALVVGAHGSRRASDLYAAIDKRIGLVRTFAATVGGLAPAVALLRLSSALPVSDLAAVANAAMFAGRLDPALAPWIGMVEGGSDLTRLATAWRELQREEAELRRLLPRFSGEWPTADLLDQATEESQRGGFAKLFGRKALRDVLARLGLADTATDIALLVRLAGHRRRLTAFASDSAGPRVRAGAWDGLGTPFPMLEAAMAALTEARQSIGALPGGAVVIAALLRATPSEFGQLAAHASAAAAYRERLPTFGTLVDATPLDAVAADCQRDIAALERVLANDPERTLAAIDLPIDRLAEIDAARRAARSATETATTDPLAAEARRLAPDPVALERMLAAVDFARRVASLGLPAALAAALLSAPAETLAALRRAVMAWNAAQGGLASAMVEVAAAGLPGIDAVPWGELGGHVEALIAAGPALSDFLALRRLRLGLEAAGLDELLAAADRHEIDPTRLPDLFDATVARRRAAASRRASEPLARRTGIDLDAKRQTFIERDRRKKETDRAFVRAGLLEREPPAGFRGGSVKTWTDMALLWHEFQKQKQLAPVRDLLRRAGGAVRALKPCFMMSALSLAKFLPAGSFTFDVLVIDEASQMRPEDALGAMLRTKQIVVVGDPKQLPPTSFFERSAEAAGDDDEAVDDVDDESILERCEKVFGQLRRLKWHYRSRCESLIRFSNEQFYDSSLVTFPAARPGSFSVDLVRVEGSFAARRNVVEAERVTEEAIAFIHHFADADDPPSLGIVALNIEQRDVIEETLWRLTADDPLFEAYQEKTGKRGEGVFVKNLENVQGDERDFIFISMTYGMAPGATAMVQRFGPINSANGHRRLNVLFSRARLRMVLFASFGSADIRPGAGSHRGVRVLKDYLHYAETRGRAAPTTTGRDADSDFEIEVAERLRKRGYSCDLQVGVSGFRIDLGVRHPDRPDTFIAGIECDGARYHASRSARDRDRLREEVLRGLGWTILRVWSTDWFDDPDTQADRLVASLEALRQDPAPGWLDYEIIGRAKAAPLDDPLAGPVDAAEEAAEVSAGHDPEPPETTPPAGSQPSPSPPVAERDAVAPIAADAGPAGGDGAEPAPAQDLAPDQTDRLAEIQSLPLFPDTGADVIPAPSDEVDPVGEPAAPDGAAEPETPERARPAAETAPRPDRDPGTAAFVGPPGTGPLTEPEAYAALVEFRETVIRPASARFEPHRSILRDGMIETLIKQRIKDPDDWFTRVPLFQRSGTDPTEKRTYLDPICTIIARIERNPGDAGRESLAPPTTDDARAGSTE